MILARPSTGTCTGIVTAQGTKIETRLSRVSFVSAHSMGELTGMINGAIRQPTGGTQAISVSPAVMSEAVLGEFRFPVLSCML